jgi:hypothetical protein
MAKFISQNAGVLTEVQANSTSAGAGDAGKMIELDGSGKIDTTLLPAAALSGADSISVQASENLAAGDLVNIHDATGARVRKADASNGYVAHGYVLAAVTSGQNATVYKEGTITGLTGKTIGVPQYLSATVAGEMVETAPTTAGHIVQRIGISFSATEVDFEPSQPITLA